MNRIGTGWETVFGFSLYAPPHLALLQVSHPCRRLKLKILHVFTHFDEYYIKKLDLSWELLCFISIIMHLA